MDQGPKWRSGRSPATSVHNHGRHPTPLFPTTQYKSPTICSLCNTTRRVCAKGRSPSRGVEQESQSWSGFCGCAAVGEQSAGCWACDCSYASCTPACSRGAALGSRQSAWRRRWTATCNRSCRWSGRTSWGDDRPRRRVAMAVLVTARDDRSDQRSRWPAALAGRDEPSLYGPIRPAASSSSAAASPANTSSITDGTRSRATASWIFGPALAASSWIRLRRACRAARA